MRLLILATSALLLTACDKVIEPAPEALADSLQSRGQSHRADSIGTGVDCSSRAIKTTVDLDSAVVVSCLHGDTVDALFFWSQSYGDDHPEWPRGNGGGITWFKIIRDSVIFEKDI